MRRLTRLTLLAGALTALALGLAACGEKQDATSAGGPGKPLTLLLDYLPNADHSGIYAAQAEGDFRRAGLDVKIQTPGNAAEPLKVLAAGKVDLAISYEPEVLLARARGLHLVSVGAIVQRPLTSIISLGPKHIGRPADLRGKRVGTAGIPYQQAYLNTILRRARVPVSSVKVTDVGFNLVPATLSGKVDATLGGYWNYEALQLAEKGKRPHVIRVDRAGVPTYDELVVVARTSTLATHGQQVRSFMQALGRGYALARRDPAKAVGDLVAANPDLDRKLQLASVKATRSIYFPASAKQPFGYQDPRRWHAFGVWMYRHGLLERAPHAENALTNEFLAGQGL